MNISLTPEEILNLLELLFQQKTVNSLMLSAVIKKQIEAKLEETDERK